ncbi:hypothetical protein [Heliophilum fasciatum]|uniref:Uncharacterized protein n=1 Tax=Heliophilum fasciatum TaxID=35700 RepID=A0A4V2SW08_9FIRM|nr:hypothetical protein [Heliophilum fasciatum]MCW2279303.1 hypothetical protein [Heliophilum fasciatum]TCP60436.1 hypothetical protein EDD73_13818 [Heliophilum fasciatum]
MVKFYYSECTIRYDGKNDNISTCFSQGWERIYQRGKTSNLSAEDEKNAIFPREYATNIYGENGEISHKVKYKKREPISDAKLFNYFHPSIQDILFGFEHHEGQAGVKAFRKKDKERKLYRAQLAGVNESNGPQFYFEHIATEVFIFSKDSGFLVVRLSLLENYKYIKEDNNNKKKWDANHKRELQDNVTLDLWLKFLNRIRQNYEKYEGQEYLKITDAREDELTKTVEDIAEESKVEIKERKFFKIVNKLLPDKCIITAKSLENLIYTKKSSKDNPQWEVNLIEPNAFVHAFAQSDYNQLSDDEIFRIASIDDYNGQSSCNDEFKAEFLPGHVYKRWAPMTYYTAIDYGMVTIAQTKQVSYAKELRVEREGEQDKKDKNKEEEYDVFADLLYQHHTKQYLIITLLQLYYRDELQELMGRYARMAGVEVNKTRKEAKQIIQCYYQLNQHYVFDRVTHEIQGMEMWRFYQSALSIKELFYAVQEDVRELHSRLLEASNEEQTKSNEEQTKKINNLTLLAALFGLLGMNFVNSEPEFAKNLKPPFGESFNNLAAAYNSVLFCISLIVIGYWIVYLAIQIYDNWRDKKE